MNRRLLVVYVLAIALGVRLAAGSGAAAAESPEQPVAREILSATGVKGGLIVHLGDRKGDRRAY